MMNQAGRPPDRDARFEQDVVPFTGQLYPAALRMTRNRCDADDLAREATARAYAAFRQFKPVTSPGARLYRILANTFSTAAGRKSTASRSSLALVSRSTSRPAPARPSRQSCRPGRGSGILQALGEQPQGFRVAIYLADIEVARAGTSQR
jgi:RNA polymerase sigma-70 factor, ECF subfamily